MKIRRKVVAHTGATRKCQATGIVLSPWTYLENLQRGGTELPNFICGAELPNAVSGPC